VTLLQGYFDDSGTHLNSEVCVVAGFRASDRNWSLFESRWVRALPDDSKHDFHAEAFFGSYGPADAALRIQVLLQAILDSDIWPIVAAIDVKAFFECTEPERKFLTGGYWNGRKLTWAGITGSPAAPFHVPFQFVVYRASEHARPGRKMNFLFDRQEVFGGYMNELYGRWKRFGSGLIENMGTFGQTSRIDNPGLQAADLLAYCTYHFCLHRFFDRPIPPKVAACCEKLQAKRHSSHAEEADFVMIGRERIQRLVADLPPSIRDGSADTRTVKTTDAAVVY
jgi:hypothetical protein